MTTPDILAVLVVVATLLVLYLYRRQHNLLQLTPPPGPKPLPILGNLFDIPDSHEYQTYAQWGKRYGDIVHVSALGKRMVILNSAEVANELLERRSTIYSDRPFIPMLHEPSLMDSNWSFVFKRYSPTWRRQRRLFVRHLSPASSKSFFESQTRAAHSLLCLMMRHPEDFAEHLRHAGAEAIFSLTYGYKIQSKGDPVVALAEYTSKTVGEGALPGRFLVNVFPWLKFVPGWVPGAGFKEYAMKAREAERRLVTEPFEDAERRIAEGTASPSFVTSALTNDAPNDILADIKAVASTMYGAGTDTIVSTMQSCVLALVLYPEIQSQAQAELDAVLGPVTSPTFRLPTFEDRPNLPYIDAIVKESLRWIPAVPLGIPHSASEGDVYRNWSITRGTVVIANAWSMLRDDKIYPDPLEFQPARFLGEKPAPHPGLRGCFGFGRRECPGQHLATNSLWIQIASLLSAFKLSPARDEEGRVIDVTYAREPPAGLILHPQQFPCVITPRSIEAEMRISEARPEEGIAVSRPE